MGLHHWLHIRRCWHLETLVGLTAGLVVAVAPNLQDSKNAHQNMVGGVAGAAAGYLIIKTLKHDWKHNK
jgi:hypothetical protein